VLHVEDPLILDVFAEVLEEVDLVQADFHENFHRVVIHPDMLSYNIIQ